jgi:hypothetical protein
MKIIEQSHKIISLPDNPLQMIEAAGRSNEILANISSLDRIADDGKDGMV